MKNITIVGIGMSPDTLTAEGRNAIESADILLGAPRLLKMFEGLGKQMVAEYAPERIAEIINRQSDYSDFVILVSGDVGFYSASEGLFAAFAECRLIPGISSLSYFCARLRLPRQDAAIISCHGREANAVDAVRRNRLTFVLTGGNTAEIAGRLTESGFGELNVYVGEKLGSDDERIRTVKAAELSDTESLTVLLIENPGHDACVRYGIRDSEFIRGKTPMTKSEVRAVTMSKLAVSPSDTVWDTGAGTGSVSIEAALAAYNGRVFAIDKNETALETVTANSRKFHVGNIVNVTGNAPEALERLPVPDAVFVGGSSGRAADIVAIAFSKNPKVRIVVNAVTLETLFDARAAFEVHEIETEIVQINVTRVEAVGTAEMLRAESPIFIISGGGG